MRSIPLPSPPLTDGDILLRSWERRDVAAVAAACQDPEIPLWTVVPYHYTQRHARDFVKDTAADRGSGRELALAIVDPEDRLMGAVGLANFEEPHEALAVDPKEWTGRIVRYTIHTPGSPTVGQRIWPPVK